MNIALQIFVSRLPRNPATVDLDAQIAEAAQLADAFINAFQTPEQTAQPVATP
jgi:hypothetical protein